MKQTRHPNIKGFPLGIVLFLCCITLGGCELLGLSDSKPANVPQQAPAPKPKKVVVKKKDDTKAEEIVEYQRPEYPNNVRRNPFQPDEEVLGPIVGIGDPGQSDRPMEPLERFTIAQLELVAIISEVAVPKAMFVDPDGFGHMIKEGDRIGRQNGVIVDIRDNEVDVRETTGEDSESQSRTRTLRLRTGEIRSSNEDDLTEAEREALNKLLNSKKGRESLRERLNGNANGKSNAGNPKDSGGIAPPTN